jgi:protein-tyrosine phosphatase
MQRVLPFDGIHNFRDYGGYATLDGGRLKSGVLFRSGQHSGATTDDLDSVTALNLKTVIDLRGNSERRAGPCLRPEGFDALVLFHDGETAGRGGAPHVEAAREIVTSDDARQAMTDLYAFMPFRPNLTAIFRLYFDALEQRDGASLLHCFAGKDRTGVGAALLHTLLGVHDDDVMADYLLTNTAGNSEARIAAGADSIRKTRGAQISDAAIRTLMDVEPDYLHAAFSALTAEHGSVAGYANAVLGVTPERVERIKARLLV